MRVRGTLLTADRDARVLRYRLLPYGEPGYTSHGKVTAAAGCLQLPAAEDVVLNLEHERTRPLGRGVQLDDTPTGLDLAVRVLATTAGDDLLVEASEGVRTGISVEVDDPVIRGGRLLGGRLTGAGAVVDPAFDSARLAFDSARLAASQLPDAPDEGDDPQPEPDEHTDEHTDDEADEAAQEDDMPPDTTTQTQAAAPVATVPRLAASRAGQAAAAAAAGPAPLTLMGAMQAIVRMRAGDYSDAARLEPAAQLFAAFGDATTSITADDVNAASQPQWLGEVWTPAEQGRRIIPLISAGQLTSLRLQGFRWTQTPTVEKYAGAIAEINSTPIALEPVNEAAQRWAGGNRIDRALTDFPDAGILASYLRHLNIDYAQKTDADCLAVLLAEATPVTPGTVPAGQSAGWAALVDAALALIEFGTPSFAVVAADLWRDMAFTTPDDVLVFLGQSLGLTGGSLSGFSIVPHPDIPAGQVLAGIKQAATHYELPGSPLRVNAQAIAVGSIDEAVFGYDGTIVHDARGLALVDTTPVIPLADEKRSEK